MPLLEHAYAIEVNNVTRVYNTRPGIVRRQKKSIAALTNVSLCVAPGELLGLVGPNGAGKTTLIKILSTLLLPTSGHANILGMDVVKKARAVRTQINVVFGGDRGLYTRLSAEDNLKYFSDLYLVPRSVAARRIPELLELVNLRGRERERVEGYSRGMKQRLHIAKALINDPPVLFLDEPTIGLDPDAARKLRQLVQWLQEQGKTMILTSHYMYEIDMLCKRVAVMNKGQLLTLDTPFNLKRQIAGSFVVEAQLIANGRAENILSLLRSLKQVERANATDMGQFQMYSVHTTAPEMVKAFFQQHIPPEEVSFLVTREPTLEDAYIQLIGAKT